MIVSFFRLLGGFSRSREGVVAVEGAILIPVFAIFMFAIYDFVSVYKQIQRAHEAYYAIGDMITAAPDGTITCDMLDRISEVAWTSYKTGNWAITDSADQTFPRGGSENFRFQIRGLRVLDLLDPEANPNNLKARVEWAYHRTGSNIANEAGRVPGTLFGMPRELRAPGEFFVRVEGRIFAYALFGRLRVTDYLPKLVYKATSTDFAPRHVAEIRLTGPKDANWCEDIASWESR